MSSNHVLPMRIYLIVGLVLLALTVITVVVAKVDFGRWNLAIALTIAFVKASLVVAYFMHLAYDNRLYLVVFTGSLLFLTMFIVLTLFDTLRRDDVYGELVSQPIQKRSIIYQRGQTEATCVSCHEHGFKVEGIMETVLAQRSSELFGSEGFECSVCHGGNPRTMDKLKAHEGMNPKP